MRNLTYYWLEFEVRMELIREEWGEIIAIWLIIFLIPFLDALLSLML